MDDPKFKVLLYSDGSHQAFSAAVYTATLFKNIPSMNLTVLHIQGNAEGNHERQNTIGSTLGRLAQPQNG